MCLCGTEPSELALTLLMYAFEAPVTNQIESSCLPDSDANLSFGRRKSEVRP